MEKTIEYINKLEDAVVSSEIDLILTHALNACKCGDLDKVDLSIIISAATLKMVNNLELSMNSDFKRNTLKPFIPSV